MIDRQSPVTEDELHAYVDDELPPDRRPAVEAWLAAHPEDAARVSAGRARAEAIRARYDTLAREPVPTRLALARLRRMERRWTRAAAAAVLAALVVGGLLGWFGRGMAEGGSALGKML